MSLHSDSIFWSRIQPRLMTVLLSSSSGVFSNEEQASHFFFFFMMLTFWSIQANWFWRMSSILKLTDCFLMIKSELNTFAEDAHWWYCMLPPHLIGGLSHWHLVWSLSSGDIYQIASRQECIFPLWRVSSEKVFSLASSLIDVNRI